MIFFSFPFFTPAPPSSSHPLRSSLRKGHGREETGYSRDVLVFDVPPHLLVVLPLLLLHLPLSALPLLLQLLLLSHTHHPTHTQHHTHAHTHTHTHKQPPPALPRPG